jgi:TRAP-type uncharacterized transport system substrate-binding protein
MRQEPIGAGEIRAQAFYQIALGMGSNRSSAEQIGEIRLVFGSGRTTGLKHTVTLATDTPITPYAVARGEVDLSVANPSAWLTMACRGTGPFPQPLPLLGVAVMPSWDYMAFAIARNTGLASLAEIREQRYPLRVSVRAASTHATRFVIDQVLGSAGFSLADLEAWGGSIHYSPSPRDKSRLEEIQTGAIDAVFDEGLNGWVPLALRHGMRPISVSAAAQERMRALGWDVGVIPQSKFPELDGDVPAIGFSGWPMFTHADAPDAVVYGMCRALDAAREQIPWDSDEPVNLADLCGTSEAAPLGVPLHAGALRYYVEHGALVS